MRTGRGLVPAFLALLILVAAPPGRGIAAPPAPVESQISQLDGVRQQCVAAALAAQQRERSIGALDLAIGVMERGVESKTRDIAQSRAEQEALLGALERLARAPPEALALTPEGPVDRLRSAILIAAAVPALNARAQELASQLAALTNVRTQIDARRKEIDDARAAMAKSRDQLAQLIARRNTLVGELLHDDGKPGGPQPLGDQASDLFDLIKRADAAADQRDKDLVVRLRVLYGVPAKAAAPSDPTRPKGLRALDAPRAEMVWPVAGELTHRFGEADRSGRPSQGLTLQAMPGAIVVAPYDGRVAYVGPFRGYGVILIIRHAGGYHSLLAGLGHVDVATGQWLLAGEPVGRLAEDDDKSAGASFYFELRREGRPVDPQSRLVSRDQKTEDVRVRE
ncbi:MAG TPA: peptidoglycan DD-metalloendopeptidase family protein [Stellaceae bacterium]|nr:peptidoglycan DD-metalloendopeptidase family protein [Stellaceae bacterium]